MIINLKGDEGALANNSTANTFFNSTCIRCVATANAVVTITTSADVQVGNTTLLAPGTYFIEKTYDDKIYVDDTNNVLATPVGFTIS